MKRKLNFSNLDFESFKKSALDESLSIHEKVGFPDSYREGREEAIFNDIKAKLSSLNVVGSIVLEIGPGCSNLPSFLIRHCEINAQKLIFIDSKEMLDLLPKKKGIKKIVGRFPLDKEFLSFYEGKIKTIIIYSVIQYELVSGNIFNFFDSALSLLEIGGEILLGDIPNSTMRKRFFNSQTGIAFHKDFVGSKAIPLPDINFNMLEPGKIDDSIVLALLSRARSQGYHAWILPQAPNLPMSNRREDILIKRP